MPKKRFPAWVRKLRRKRAVMRYARRWRRRKAKREIEYQLGLVSSPPPKNPEIDWVIY